MSNPDGTDLYKQAGVDVAAGDRLVDWLKEQAPVNPLGGEVVGSIGGFAGLFRPDFSQMKDPLLVSGTDGVGTKVLLACEAKQYDGLGQDLVAMCINDLYTIGATPLFFLDYFATGAIDEQAFKGVVSSIRHACVETRCALLGGETAEMPGLYSPGHFDLAGFVVGVVDREKMLGPHLVKGGDKIIGVASSGFHSNGYSLIRKWLDANPQMKQDATLIKNLLAPTTLYTELPNLVAEFGVAQIHAAANVTGGGLSGNLPRVLAEDTKAEVYWDKLRTPDWMGEFIEKSGSTRKDVEGTFNLGTGFVVVVSAGSEQAVINHFHSKGREAFEIGQITNHQGDPTLSYL